MSTSRFICRACRLSLTRSFSTKPSAEQWPQRTPLGPYYESVLKNPTPYPFKRKPEEPPSTANPNVLPPGKKPLTPPPTKEKPGQQASEGKTIDPGAPTAGQAEMDGPARARIMFGASLSGPAERAERLARIKSQSQMVAGVLIPPKPEEPDNCCMSGCVNCVWERFREDMEDWTAATKRAAEARAKEKAGDAAASATSMDSDGGGSETNWTEGTITKDMWDDDLFQGVPVGIREFMKQEKKLKLKHELEGTSGG